MKKKIIIVLFALLIGAIGAYYLFNKVTVTASSNEATIKAFQIGAYSSYENALRQAERNNGVVITDQGIYRVYVALINDTELITKMRAYYDSLGLDYYIRDIKVNTSFIKDINLSEKMLKESSTDTYTTINLEILKKYKEKHELIWLT